MLTLARYTLKGPYYAASIVGILAILAVLFPLASGSPLLGALIAMTLTYLSGSLVGLIILTQGLGPGLKAIAVSVLGITLIATLLLKAPDLGLSIALVQWLPIVVLAQTYRATGSMALTLMAGALLGALVVVLQYLLWPDLEANWLAMVQQSFQQLPESENYSNADFAEQIGLMMHWLILALVASVYLIFASIVLIARWIQAKLAESDGYRQEFLALAFGKPASLVALILLALSFWIGEDWISSLAILVAAVFLFQGVAVVHARLENSKYKSLLLGLFYALLLILPQAMALTMITGILDNWLFFRRRGKSENSSE